MSERRPQIALLDYGIGNLRSAQKALEKVGADARLTADPAEIEAADAVVMPGVGAFGRCVEALQLSGLDVLARKAAIDATEGGRPFLGVCVGMQMLFEASDESPGTAGLGVLGGQIRLLPAEVKRPQMQWNTLRYPRSGAIADALGDDVWMYFVHSYWAEASDQEVVAAVCDYGVEVTAAVEVNNLWATQFHPEKSASSGLRLLKAFVERSTSSA